jgi:hypothetical protein
VLTDGLQGGCLLCVFGTRLARGTLRIHCVCVCVTFRIHCVYDIHIPTLCVTLHCVWPYSKTLHVPVPLPDGSTTSTCCA